MVSTQELVMHTVAHKFLTLRLTALFPAPSVRVLSGHMRLTSVCLSRTSGRNREQRGLGRLKLAQRYPRHTRLGGCIQA